MRKPGRLNDRLDLAVRPDSGALSTPAIRIAAFLKLRYLSRSLRASDSPLAEATVLPDLTSRADRLNLISHEQSEMIPSQVDASFARFLPEGVTHRS